MKINIKDPKDLPVGYELRPVIKQAVIQLMGSRYWGRRNPLHWDPVTAAKEGLQAPIATGHMSSAYIAEMLVNHFGKHVFQNTHAQIKLIKPVFAGETITTHGVIREKISENSGYRFKLDVWTENQESVKKTVGWVETYVE